MKREILNRRRILLAGYNQKTERDWYEFLQKIEDADRLDGVIGIHQYFNTQPNTSQPKQGEQKEGYFPKSLEIFRAIVEKQKQGKAIYNQNAPNQVVLPSLKGMHNSYDILITMVGFSPQPLMHTLLSINPKKVYLIATQESQYFNNIPIKDYFDFLIQQYGNGTQITVEKPTIVKEIGSFDTFQKAKQIIEANPNAKIAIDITGGKKSMDSSAFLVGAISENIDIFYVDFEEYENSRPVYGTEFLNKLDNPYKIYNIREEALIKEFWERKDYAQVVVIASKLLKSFTEKEASLYGLTTKREEFLAVEQAARCYKAWLRFDYKTAFENSDLQYFKEHHECLVNTLENCQESRWTPKGAIYLAMDRWMRGCDFIEKDLDKAALCFTQTIECLSEFRLVDKKGNTDQPNFNLAGDFVSLKALLDYLYLANKNNLRTLRLNQTITWNDNSCKFDPINSITKHNDLEKVIKTRNNLAHYNCYGVKVIDAPKEVNKLRDVSKQYIELFMTHKDYESIFQNTNFDKLKKQFKFASYAQLTKNQ